MKEVGFKPWVKEKWSYRCTKWWIRRERSDKWRNRWVGDGGTGARMRFTKRQRELIPETRWSITEGAISCFSVTVSQWRERRIGVIWHDLGAFMTARDSIETLSLQSINREWSGTFEIPAVPIMLSDFLGYSLFFASRFKWDFSYSCAAIDEISITAIVPLVIVCIIFEFV